MDDYLMSLSDAELHEHEALLKGAIPQPPKVAPLDVMDRLAALSAEQHRRALFAHLSDAQLRQCQSDNPPNNASAESPKNAYPNLILEEGRRRGLWK